MSGSFVSTRARRLAATVIIGIAAAVAVIFIPAVAPASATVATGRVAAPAQASGQTTGGGWGTAVREEVAWQPQESDARTTADLLALPVADFVPAVFDAPSGRRLPYRLLHPAQEQAGARYPLVVVFHGSGAVGEDNLSQLNGFARSWSRPDIRQAFPAFVLAPQFPARSANYSRAEDGTTHADPGAVFVDALELLDQTLTRYPIDPDRVYVVGFSMGASTAWHALLARPRTFAGAVVMAGVPPTLDMAENLRLPIMVTHGTADTENPLPPTERFMERLLAINPLARVRLYRGLDHRLPVEITAGTAWRSWLFAQLRLQTTRAVSPGAEPRRATAPAPPPR